MRRFMQRISKFMYGRYGNDKFNAALLVLYLVVAVINIIVKSIYAVSVVFFLQWTILGMVIFRMFSRNIPARRRENEWFERNFSGTIKWFQLFCHKIRDIKFKRYRKCPNCKAILRLPIRKGKHRVQCPSCKTYFTVRIIF